MKKPNSFVGKTGRFYVKNPFNDGKYCYAIYNSVEAYSSRHHLPAYTTADEAMADFEKEVGLPPATNAKPEKT